MRGGIRLLLVVAGIAAAVVLFLVFRGGDDDDTPTATPPPASVSATRTTHPQPAPEPEVILVPINTDAVTRRTIPRGRRVVLVISGAAGEEVHLHGYDVTRHVGRGGTVRLPFRATIPGRFEVELETSQRQIADLTVG